MRRMSAERPTSGFNGPGLALLAPAAEPGVRRTHETDGGVEPTKEAETVP